MGINYTERTLAYSCLAGENLYKMVRNDTLIGPSNIWQKNHKTARRSDGEKMISNRGGSQSFLERDTNMLIKSFAQTK